MFLDYLSLFCSLDYVRRRSTPSANWTALVSCPCHICLLVFDPACVLTMLINKSLHMDPHASRLCLPITEYLATQGSSSFSEEHWPGTDTAKILLALKQGPRSLENYIREFLVIANYSDLPDCLLIEFFCDGINQPLRSELKT